MSSSGENLHKEVFALFGAAYYFSESVHRGLSFVYALYTFQRRADVTAPRLEEKMVRAFLLTLGILLKEVQLLLPEELYQRLEGAVERRNFLAHHFWYERIHLMYSENGLRSMMQELQELIELFNGLDDEISDYLKPKRDELGITDQLVDQAQGEILDGKDQKLLLRKRKPEKQERLIHIWDVPTPDGQSTLIFETEDHTLWQLCDVGLGWTRFDTPSIDWKLHEELQKYLPMAINPRPSLQTPWNYEIPLKKGVTLWIKPGVLEKTFTWGIRKKTV